jgi:hypothetical protein
MVGAELVEPISATPCREAVFWPHCRNAPLTFKMHGARILALFDLPVGDRLLFAARFVLSVSFFSFRLLH